MIRHLKSSRSYPTNEVSPPGDHPLVHRIYLPVVCLIIALVGCESNDGTASSDNGGNSQSITHDFTTPEGAILSLGDAYRAKDIEAAVRCKDFTIEAELMLQNFDENLRSDPEILAKTIEVLELGFRSQLKTTGFPDFREIESSFSEKRPYQGHDDIVEIEELCRHSDGSTSTNTLVVAKTAVGWKVVAVPE
ncbi:MAG: hypothetical protein AAFN77_04120 [Planctomycetota bacterium]